jgi:hypothetical protein
MTALSQSPEKVKVLFVAANPRNKSQLLLDEEIREITQKVLATSHRDLLTFHQIWATRPNDLLQALNQHKPGIVHFSAHGSPTGEIFLLNKHGNATPVDTATLERLFTILKDNVRVVFLNACYSQIQARAITKVIECAIGMQASVTDNAAIEFASAFYQALGFGRSVRDAFEQGKVALQLEGIPEHDIPHLLLKKGVDPKRVCIIHDVQGREKRGKIRNRLKNIENTIIRGDYHSAYHDIIELSKQFSEEMLSQEAARLKYLEALVHLNGKRPYTQSPSVMKQVEAALQAASRLHNLCSYKIILALLKQDFARTGVQVKQNQNEAHKLLSRANRLPIKQEDREIIALFSRCYSQLSQEYSYLLSR